MRPSTIDILSEYLALSELRGILPAGTNDDGARKMLQSLRQRVNGVMLVLPPDLECSLTSMRRLEAPMHASLQQTGY
jgi:hypothetical protein